MLFDFAWENKRHLISKDTLILTHELGGLKMVSVTCLVETAKLCLSKDSVMVLMQNGMFWQRS